ncbi:hypothetical protein [Nannocystis punicea]|uniref:Uncharacterized protein n=1 Tax=Nannocystis punicea TaxID=2995304 RepID=A0ABY7GUG2_9BACT|nr:hypothetical protein [Nannocystis poenicansa]WAS90591.1 hypothetical protein O0S08_30760 [Nannocystis poenicansa]
MFGLFRKSRFPKFTLGPEVGPYELKVFIQQQKIKLQWAHGQEALALFVPWLVQDQLDYYVGLDKLQKGFRAGVMAYVDAPKTPVWALTDDVKPENYLMIGGTWHTNGIGATRSMTGQPVEQDMGRIEAVKALIHHTGNDPRVLAAIRHVFAFHDELGSERKIAKRGGRLVEAWRLASGG